MKAKLAIAACALVLLGAGAYWYTQRGVKLTLNDSIIIGDIQNATKDPQFDSALKEALHISLAQSPSLNVVSIEKVSEALHAMGMNEGAPLNKETAPKLCQRLGATVYVNGSVEKDGEGYALRLKAAHCADGEEFASSKAAAAGKKSVLPAWGTAVSALREKFGEEPAAMKRFDLPLERATSASLEAVASFSEGRRLVREKGALDGVPALKKAIELDSRFALAHSNLAVAYYNLNQNALAAENIRDAFEAADRQTVRDRLHITTLYYDLATGDVEKAIASYQEWVRLYPRDDIAKGNLSSEYFLIGDYENAATFAQQALRLDAGSAAWYENVATAYIALDRLEEAQAILDQAAARQIDDPAMHSDRYAIAFLKGETAGMEKEMAWSQGKPNGEDDLLALQADTEAYRGHAEKARELSRRAVEVAQQTQLAEPAAIWEGMGALREAYFGNAQEARKGADKVLDIAPKSRDAQVLAILILTRIGQTQRAQTMLDDLTAANVSNTIVQSAWAPTIRAELAMADQKPAKALEVLENVRPYERGQLIGNLSYSCMIPVYLRGEAYLAAGKGPLAYAEFQKLLDSRGVVGNCWSAALAPLQQARAKMLLGSKDGARAKYQEFFALWKDADSNVPILKMARAEYAKLK